MYGILYLLNINNVNVFIDTLFSLRIKETFIHVMTKNFFFIALFYFCQKRYKVKVGYSLY